MKTTLAFSSYVDDFLAVNEFKVAKVIKEHFNGNVDAFFKSGEEYRRFITKSSFGKRSSYNGEIYAHVRHFNYAGWHREESRLCLGKNYDSADFMAKFRDELGKRGLTHIDKGVLSYKGKREHFPPKWLPTKARLEAVLDNDALWTEDASGKCVLNYNTDAYTKRQARIIKKLLGLKPFDTIEEGVETREQTNETEEDETEMNTRTNEPGVLPKAYLDKCERASKRAKEKRQLTMLTNKTLEEVEKRCGQRLQTLQSQLNALEDEVEELRKENMALCRRLDKDENEFYRHIENHETMIESRPNPTPPPKDDDDPFKGKDAFNLDKWKIERVVAFCMKHTQDHGCTHGVLDVLKPILSEADFNRLFHAIDMTQNMVCSRMEKWCEDNGVNFFNMRNISKGEFACMMLKHIRQECFLINAVPKVFDKAKGEYVPDVKSWEKVKNGLENMTHTTLGESEIKALQVSLKEFRESLKGNATNLQAS